MLEQIGIDMLSIMRPFFIRRLNKARVMMETKARVVEITDKGVTAIQGEVSRFFEGDAVVLTIGMESENSFARRLRAKLPSVHLIGDCVKPRTISEAMDEGYLIGLKIQTFMNC